MCCANTPSLAPLHTRKHIDKLIAALNYGQRSLKGTSFAFFKEIIKTFWQIVGETFKVLPDGPLKSPYKRAPCFVVANEVNFN